MKISCIDKEVKSVLESGFYRIPRFQRPYSWEQENVEEFWEDTIAHNTDSYFIGSMVVYRINKVEDVLGVVDGQQRLTTITILLSIIRDKFMAEGYEGQARGMHQLIERPDISNNQQFVLQTETSYPYLQEQIQLFDNARQAAVAPGDEEKLLKAAYDFFARKVDESIREIKQDRNLTSTSRSKKTKETLETMRDKLLGLKLILVDLDNEEDAYLIFETLNTRGKDLSIADLVKSHITKLLRPKNQGLDRPKEQWVGMVSEIEGSPAELDVDTFLHYFWLSRYEYTTAKKLFKAIRRKVDKKNAKEFLDAMISDARTYRGINEPSYLKLGRNEQAIKDCLEALNLFRVRQPLPMLLSVMRDYKAGEIKTKQAVDILKSIECFHFMFTAVTSQRSSGGISLMYASHAQNLFKADAPGKVEQIKSLREKLKTKVPMYAEFEANFLEILYTDSFTKQKKLVQYILQGLDSLNPHTVPPDYSAMTIEHIGAQRPQGGRMSEASLGSLGNLLYVSQTLNSELDNKPFTDKKEILIAYNYPLDPILTDAIDWTEEKIEARAKYLANKAYNEVWKIR